MPKKLACTCSMLRIIAWPLMISSCIAPCASAQHGSRVEISRAAALRSIMLYGEPASSHSQQFTNRKAPEHSVGRLSLGGVAGYALGIGSGVLIGYITDSDTQESWIGVTDGMVVGGLVGGSLGAPIGVYLSNRRKGNILLMVAVSGVLQYAALPLLELGSPPVLFLPLVQIGTSIVIAKITS